MEKFITYTINLFLGIFIIFFILDMINITQYVPFTQNYDWLNFFGALLGSAIGGTITYLGVYLSLKYQKKSDDEQKRLSIIPVLEYKLSYNKSDFDNSNGQLADEGFIPHINIENAKFNDKNSCEWYYDIKVKNVGLGPAQVKNLKFIIGDNYYNKIAEENIGYVYKLVKCNEERDLRFMIYAPKSRFKNNHIGGKEFLYTIIVVIEYQDLLGNCYTQKIYTGITTTVFKLDKKIINKFSTADLYYYDNFEVTKR